MIKICLKASNSLLPVSQLCKVTLSTARLNGKGSFGVRNDDVVKPILKKIKEHSDHKRQLLLIALMYPESPFELKSPHTRVVYEHFPIPETHLPKPPGELA